MNVRPFAVAVCAVAGLSLTACGSSTATSTPSTSTSSAAANDAAPASTAGDFSGLNGKKVAGHAEISDGMLTLSKFSSDKGPDLHVYLTNGTTEADVSSGKEVGAVTYSDTAKFSVSSVDNASGYKYVVIHCDKAKAVFGAASLS